MNRRAFLKLAAGVSGAIGLGLVSKRPERLPAVPAAPTKRGFTKADLDRFYDVMTRAASKPIYYEGEWCWRVVVSDKPTGFFSDIFPLRP